MNSSRIHILSVREIKNGRGRKNTSRVLYRVNVNPLVQLEFQPIFTTNCDTRASNVDARAVFRAAEVKQQNIDLGAHTTRFHPRMKVVHAGPSGAYIPLTYVDRFDEVDDEDPLFWPSCKSALRYEVMAYEKLKPYNHPAFLEYHGVVRHRVFPDRVLGVCVRCPPDNDAFFTIVHQCRKSPAEWCHIYATLLHHRFFVRSMEDFLPDVT